MSPVFISHNFCKGLIFSAQEFFTTNLSEKHHFLVIVFLAKYFQDICASKQTLMSQYSLDFKRSVKSGQGKQKKWSPWFGKYRKPQILTGGALFDFMTQFTRQNRNDRKFANHIKFNFSRSSSLSFSRSCSSFQSSYRSTSSSGYSSRFSCWYYSRVRC